MTGEYATAQSKTVAFYAYPAGLGCSGMVANIALILGSWGYRVLAVDRNYSDPSLYRYLSTFLPDGSVDQSGHTRAPAADAGPAVAPVTLDCHFVDPRGVVALLGPAAPDLDGTAGTVTGLAEPAGSGYDFVLIDLPAGTGGAHLIDEAIDTLVIGYGLNRRVITKVSADVQALRDSERGRAIQILPIPLRVDKSAGSPTELMLTTGRLEFAHVLGAMPEARRQHYLTDILIPYEPEYTIDEGLAFLDDSSGQRDRLVAAYARFAGEIAPGRRPAPRGAVTDETRARYRAARLAAVTDRAAVTVIHAPADRYWAEWLVSELQQMRLTVSRRGIDQERPASPESQSELLVVSATLLDLPERDAYLRLLAGQDGDSRVRLAVSVDGSTLPTEQLPAHGHVDLSDLSQDRARSALASYYRVASGAPAGSGRLRYPGVTEKGASTLSNLPTRGRICRGRDDEIDQIRDYFTAAEAPHARTLTLTGPAGIGKSRIALEYASRFADYYDLVFRVHADSLLAVRTGLNEMAARLPDLRPAGDAAVSALRYLDGHPSAPGRWLLIYEGAESPAVLNGLLPTAGSGHVLVTSRTPADPAAVLAVPPLPAAAARSMLADLVPGIFPGEAAQVVSTLAYVPLAIRLAGGWLNVVVRQLLAGGMSPATVVSNAVRELIDQLTPESAGPDGPVPVAVELLLRLLRAEQHGAAALLLLETCAFLAPSGMSGRLLRSSGMLRQLSGVDPDLADPVLVSSVQSMLASYGFTVSDPGAQNTLRIHPRVRELLRQRLTPDEQAARSEAVTQMLAAHAPVAIEDDVPSHEIYAELLPHVEPSGAPLQLDPEVRRWMVNQVRFLWQRETVSAWRITADLAERLAQHWATALPDKDDDPLLLRLRTQLGNVYRSLCQFEHARAVDLDVLSRQRRVLGLTHLRTLMTARSYAADLRLIGKFEEALNVDQSTWQAFRETLGDEHVMTIRASDNMALSELLYGDAEHALRRQLADVRHAERIEAEQPAQRPWVLFHVGTLQRELGYYEESAKSLDEAKWEFGSLVGDGRLAPTLWVVLRTAAGLAITERRLGRPVPETTRAILKTCRDTYGADYPDVIALELSLAGDLNATGRPEEAVTQADEARRRSAAVFGSAHPITKICEIDQSIYALAADKPKLAAELSTRALTALAGQLNPGHPWLQAAAVARANVLAVTGHPADALALEETALAEYRRRLRPGNPLLRTIAINHANTRMLLNQPSAIPDSEKGLQRRSAIEIDIPPY